MGHFEPCLPGGHRGCIAHREGEGGIESNLSFTSRLLEMLSMIAGKIFRWHFSFPNFLGSCSKYALQVYTPERIIDAVHFCLGRVGLNDVYMA